MRDTSADASRRALPEGSKAAECSDFGGDQLDHPRQWWGAQWPGLYPGCTTGTQLGRCQGGSLTMRPCPHGLGERLRLLGAPSGPPHTAACCLSSHGHRPAAFACSQAREVLRAALQCTCGTRSGLLLLLRWQPPPSPQQQRVGKRWRSDAHHHPSAEASSHVILLYIYAPEGCQHGTHTNGTAYTRGTYSRVHTQTHSHVICGKATRRHTGPELDT